MDMDLEIQGLQEKDIADEIYEDIEIRDPDGTVHKRRGKTRAKDIWTLPKGTKVLVECNDLGQPVKKGGGILGGWLGTVARKKEFCSIEYSDWRKMREEDKNVLWDLTKVYFVVPDKLIVKKWVLTSVRAKWKNYKHELKCAHFSSEKTEQQILKDVPKGISPLQWAKLVRYWFSDDSKKLSERGKKARKHHITPHTCGSKSFARCKEEFEVKNGKQLGRIDFFAITRKKKDGSFVNPEVEKIVDTATNMISERSATLQDGDADILQNEVFCELLGEDQYGRVKGYGLGVTPTQVGVGQTFHSKERQSSDLESMRKELGEMQSTYETKIENLTVAYENTIAKLKDDMNRMQREFLEFKEIMSQKFPDFSESAGKI